TAEFFLAEYTGVAPTLIIKDANVQNIDDDDITWLSALDAYGTRKMVTWSEIDIANVVGAIVIADLAARPVEALNPERISWRDFCNHRNIRMPSVYDYRIV